MLKWLDSRTVSKAKFDALSEDERAGLFPLGVLYEDNGRTEYTKAYQKVIDAAQSGEVINFEGLR